MKIVFGVKPGYYKNGKSAQEVAEIIEKHYGLFATYIDMYQEKIAEEATEIIAKSIVDGGLTKPVVMEKATTRFKRALTERRFDGKIAGVPTRASLTGKSRVTVGRSRKKAGKHGSGHVMVYKRKTRAGSVPVFTKGGGFREAIPVQRNVGYTFVEAIKAVRARPSFIDTGLYRRSMQVVLMP